MYEQIDIQMKLRILFLLLFISTSGLVFCQVDNISASDPVYDFLLQLEIRGIITNYSDVVLPYPRSFILQKLNEAKKSNHLTESETSYLNRLIERLTPEQQKQNNLFSNFPENVFKDSVSHIYFYNDSLINFQVNPVGEIKILYSDYFKDKSLLLNFGGEFIGSYNGWMGFYLKATNGSQFFNRNVAENDKRVSESFTFNKTKLTYFDDTEGYLRLEKGIAGFEIGRERVLWGNGYVDQMILSQNPPEFDIIKFDLAYKSFTYNFVHGWLVNPSATGSKIEPKISKYIALSRLGFNPGNKFSIGATQTVIYGNRPPELAYLTPFLFWESAQRSLGDFDNSFLSFDMRYLLTSGIEARASITFDDINPKFWNGREWTNKENRIAWQVGSMLTYPYFFNNSFLQIEYTQLRPYIFSHYGSTDNILAYTNNDLMLGPDLQPNSTRLSIKLHHQYNDRLNGEVIYKHTLHGNNIYDDEGKLIKSYGGDVFRFFKTTDENNVPLLSGSLEKEDQVDINISYEITFQSKIYLGYRFYRFNSPDISSTANLFTISFSYSLN